MKAKDSLTLAELDSLFQIDENSPSGLSWKIYKKHKIKPGTPAGCLTKYYTVVINGTKYRVHRIIYQIHHKIEILSGDVIIDHMDGNRLNNSVNNLRLATAQQNSRNVIRNCDPVKDISKYYHFSLNFRKDEFSYSDVMAIKRKIINEMYGEFSAYNR
jgi:hypothetical protein